MASQLKHTVKPSGGDYTSLTAAIAGIATDHGGDLVSADVYWDIEIDGSWSSPDTAAFSMVDITATDATHYVNIYTTGLARHEGVLSTSKYLFAPTGSDSTGISIVPAYVRFDGIQFSASGNASLLYMLRPTANTATSLIRISNCICDGNGTAISFWGDQVLDFAITAQMWNCIAYDFAGGYGVVYHGGAGTFNCYNVTLYKNTNRGFRQYGAGTFNCYNCASFNSTNYDFLGTIGGDYNIASDATAPGANSLQSKVAANQFVDIGAGTEDLHLKVGADCIGAGVADPGSGLFSDDIDGDARGATWDIGADEYAAGGATNVVMNIL